MKTRDKQVLAEISSFVSSSAARGRAKKASLSKTTEKQLKKKGINITII